MNFLTMQQEVASQLGLDLTDTTIATSIKRWINITQQDICGRWPWEFLYSEEIVKTVPDKSAGTVSVSAGGTTVTGIATSFSATDVGSYIQFDGALEWYPIETVTPTTSLTISSAYNGTSNLSNGTYVIRKIYYSLSSSADSIITIRNMNTPLSLIEADVMQFDRFNPNSNSTGTTSMYISYGYDSSGNIRITPWPIPSDARNLNIRTLKRITDLSGNTDSSIIPVKWNHILIYGAIGLGFMFLRKESLSDRWVKKYEDMFSNMKAKERISENHSPILNSIDIGRKGSFIPFPSNYPRT
jgi:hypothetical protein